MKYFLDTEFIEDGKTIDLAAIGIVAEDGRELYAESTETDWTKASPWVIKNVRPHLWSLAADKSKFNAWSRDGGKGGLLSRAAIRWEVLNFCSVEQFGKPQFWGYYADYDWVAFCQLFGAMIDLPKGYPMYCRDLKQLCDSLGNPPLPKPEKEIHHALVDALWIKEMHSRLTTGAISVSPAGAP